jgi:hypothetical protein
MAAGDLNMLALNLKSLINFDSPRFLISEVSSASLLAEKIIHKSISSPEEKSKEALAYK